MTRCVSCVVSDQREYVFGPDAVSGVRSVTAVRFGWLFSPCVYLPSFSRSPRLVYSRFLFVFFMLVNHLVFFFLHFYFTSHRTPTLLFFRIHNVSLRLTTLCAKIFQCNFINGCHHLIESLFPYQWSCQFRKRRLLSLILTSFAHCLNQLARRLPSVQIIGSTDDHVDCPCL